MTLSFHQVLDNTEQLSVEEQETLIDILQKRIADKRRDEIVQEIQQARQEHIEGKTTPVSPDDLVMEIFS